MKISDRTFIISGGSAGLGLATVENLHEAGAYLAVLDLKPSRNSFEGLPRVAFFKTNITKTEEIQEAVDKAAEWAAKNNAPLGGVIHCAGVGTAAKVVESDGRPHSLELWNFTLGINLTGTFNLSRLVCPHLIKVAPEGPDEERGVIVMVASSAAFEGQPGQTAYAASKGAIRSMTLPMARDLGRYGIRVNTIAPSAFASDMTARMPPKTKASLEREMIFPRRMGQGPEFAQTVKWILECPYANGDTYRLSAGSRMPARM
ncbi:putative 3-hydroxyacyl-CoA dehydrogenase [Sistotremastrum niveocremeum HHB9708]|uniref:Putative 3-hydroxyacyl-CoA dehydrogenase n=1 Tax=Sistotremastrum niveocremeum HHB9708 TaxID=1314777 RepID=A0A164VQF3_9AGAM|nr:putative 3-hydroxyacyl-CoA dehydrogenase [Sistotremastrum niveocremeum HHB9708]